MQGLWEKVRDGWQPVWDAYRRLPTCVCHNDAFPRNAIYVDGVVTLLDLGLVGLNPIGSDMHCVIRWSGDPLTRRDEAEDLLELHAQGIARCGLPVGIEEVRLAAWTTFYLRYSDLKFRSAWDESAFRTALREISRLIDRYSRK